MNRFWIKTLQVASLVGLFALAQSSGRSLADNPPMGGDVILDAHLINDVYRATDILKSNILFSLNRTKPIIVTSLVNFNNFRESSSFGRMVSDLFATRLAQHGYKIIEFKLRKDSIVVNKNGEFALSRDLFALSKSQSAQAIIVGTYSTSGSTAIITIKMLNSDNGAMIATHAFTLPIKQAAMVENAYLKNDLQEIDIKEISHDGKTKTQFPGMLETATLLLNLKHPNDAKLVQHRLSELNLYTAKIDGIWGKKSKAALSTFIRRNDLSPADAWSASIQKALFQGTGR